MLKGIEDAKNKGFKGEQLQVLCHVLPVSCPTHAGMSEGARLSGQWLFQSPLLGLTEILAHVRGLHVLCNRAWRCSWQRST